MKSFLLSLAVLPLALTLNPAARADTYDLTLKSGTTVDDLGVGVPVIFHGIAAEQFTYVNESLGILNLNGVLDSTTSTVVVTYADLNPDAAVLNVTDACVDVFILGHAPGCQSFALSLTNVTLGDGSVGDITAGLLLGANATVGLGAGGLSIDGASIAVSDVAGAGVGGANGTLDIGGTNPPAATPEPSSLYLMGTGLATAAGVVRRRFLASLNA